jgi:hypothetical protein
MYIHINRYTYIYVYKYFYLHMHKNIYIYIYIYVKRISPPQIPPSCSDPLQVGKLVRDHLRTASNEQEPITDQGLSFFDSGSESDDSGLGDLIGNIDL